MVNQYAKERECWAAGTHRSRRERVAGLNSRDLIFRETHLDSLASRCRHLVTGSPGAAPRDNYRCRCRCRGGSSRGSYGLQACLDGPS